MKSDEKIKVQKGIKLYNDNFVKPVDRWEQHGWFLVFRDNRPSVVDDPNSDLESSNDIFRDEESSSNNMQDDHNYSIGNDATNILRILKSNATNLFKEQLLNEMTNQGINISYNTSEFNIVNVFLLICSCPVFVSRGQMHPCKHIAASICFSNNTNDENAIITILESTPPVLTTFYSGQPVNFEPASQNFDLIEHYLPVSHIASSEELESAAQGSLLKPMDENDNQNDIDLSGRPARDITNRPYRRKKEKRKLKKGSQGVLDKYRPKIDFRKNVKLTVLGKRRLSSHPRKNIASEYENNRKQLDVDIDQQFVREVNLQDYKAKVWRAGLAKRRATKHKIRKGKKNSCIQHCFYCRKLLDPVQNTECLICKKKFHKKCAIRCSGGDLSKTQFVCKWCGSFKSSSVKSKVKKSKSKRQKKT